ncbi:hypothetical protein GWI33_022143 [Rhynchophorus ferrugineus]|uniref:Uncharacterized protein n=1 Tax=Rhynchophorus ferrugineus TaxID=354439 RepID=A0A834MLB0_RHYFE|nr:hypothetical protein GWI33_022143 [Rhynchophorus ferrugineus]
MRRNVPQTSSVNSGSSGLPIKIPERSGILARTEIDGAKNVTNVTESPQPPPTAPVTPRPYAATPLTVRVENFPRPKFRRDVPLR